jgi:hypothetical protein
MRRGVGGGGDGLAGEGDGDFFTGIGGAPDGDGFFALKDGAVGEERGERHGRGQRGREASGEEGGGECPMTNAE